MTTVARHFLAALAGRSVIPSLLRGALLGWSLLAGGLVSSQVQAKELGGVVQGSGMPIAGATVTLYAAGNGEPKQWAQGQTGDDGTFRLNIGFLSRALEALEHKVLYVVATGGTPRAAANKGGNDAIALMTVLGSEPPAKVVINEFTTVASVWTNAQFLDGTAIKGRALGLRIAAGNVPNFVNLETGGWGDAIQGPLNSSQTPTMANFATLANVLAGCVTRVSDDACPKLFAAAAPPQGAAPTNTLTAAESIALHPWYQPERLFPPARPILPGPEEREPARGSFHAVPQLGTERLGPAAQVRRRRVSRGR